MPKKRLATRIDLDYTKNLKYPDVNEFLKDSMYASNLTEFPDNPENTITFFRAVPDSITAVGTTLTVGTNLTFKPYLSIFKMYGYIGTLEAVDRMELEFDFLNEGDDQNTKKYEIKKRGGVFDLDITQNSEIKGLNLPTIVNFSVKFPVAGLVTIFNYVFSTKWKEAYAYYLNDVVLEADLEAQSAYYSRQLWLFVRNNLYTLDIPAKVNIYYVDSTEPAAVISTVVSLDSMLPQYKNIIDLDTSAVAYNAGFDLSLLNTFQFSFDPAAIGKLRIKGHFTGVPARFEEDPIQVISKLSAAGYTSAIMAKKYADAQHGSYDVSFPELTFTYDFFINDDDDPIVDNKLFAKFKSVPRGEIVKGLMMQDYKFGHAAIKDITSNPLNPFKFSLTFISNSNQLQNGHFKFQLSFKSDINLPPDINPVHFNTTREMAFIYGDFLNDSSKSRTFKTNKELLGATWLNSASATQVNSSGFLVYSQRTSNKNNAVFSTAALVNCSVTLSNLGTFLSEKKPVGTQYKLEITWPTTIDEQALYLITKCSYIELSISDYFQSVLHSGQIRKNNYDAYYDDETNPLYNPSVVHFPKFSLRGHGGSRDATNFEKYHLEKASNSTLFNWSDHPNAGVKVLPLVWPKNQKYKVISYVLLNYLKGTNKFKTCTSPYFMDQGYIVLAHKLTGKSLIYMTASRSVRNLKHYYYSYSYNSETSAVQISFDQAKLQLAAKSIMGKSAKQPLPPGAYYVYIITGITATVLTGKFNLCTLIYESGNKFKTNFLMQYEFIVK